MVNNSKVIKEYNTLSTELQKLNMSYMKKKTEKEDSTGSICSKEQSQDHSATSNKMDTGRKKLNASDEESSSRFSRARSSTCEGVRTLVQDIDQPCLRRCHPRSRTLDSEPRGPSNCEGSLQHQHNPMNSPLAPRKFGRHVFEKRTSLPSSLPCSPRSTRRNSDFISSKHAGLNEDDIRRLSGSLSEFEKGKPNFGRHLMEKRASLPCSVTNSPRCARRNSDFISSKHAGLNGDDIKRLSGSLSELEKGKPNFGRHLMEKRASLPCSVTNSPRFARRNSDFISSKQVISAEDIRRLTESLSQQEKAKPRSKLYEEKPFYLCPENGSFRRNFWKSESAALEQQIMEAQKKKVSRVEEEKDQEETPLAEILPPLALSSIYAQETNKEKKRKEVGKETKKKTRSGLKNGSNERLSVDVLTKNLSDCRYLRIPNNSR